jgi:hypothetical protein
MNLAIARNARIVHHGDVVAQRAVVRNMARNHQKIVVPYYGRRPLLCTTVYCREFPDRIVVPDRNTRPGILERKVLRNIPNVSVAMYMIALAYFRDAGNDRPGTDFVIGPHFNRAFNHHVRAYFIILANLRSLINNCRGVNSQGVSSL